VGAFGGRRDIMDFYDPRKGGARISHGGTFNANPVTMAAGIATLNALTPEAYARLDALGERLRGGVTRLLAATRRRGQVTGLGSLFWLHWTTEPLSDYRSAKAKASVEKALAAWTKAGDKPSFDYPKLPELQTAKIYLVDKPGSAQSVVNIGLPGPPRNTPDYFALQVLNQILGGQFQSRLNANIREQKGYSYGVNSGFNYGKGPGAFRAGGSIFVDKTDAALIEFFKEFNGIVGEKPITDEEITTAKESLIQALPARFTSVTSIGGSITSLTVQGLPDDYYQTYAKNVSAVTKEDLLRVAKQYIDLKHLAIVIVGDRAVVEAKLKATGIAPITYIDIDGNPVAGAPGSTN